MKQTARLPRKSAERELGTGPSIGMPKVAVSDTGMAPTCKCAVMTVHPDEGADGGFGCDGAGEEEEGKGF